ncbi:MAG: amidohydrolase family protein [Planctomycetes bacterium]|nr:amidohydrolase family protein [Planctomycetota bacterium]
MASKSSIHLAALSLCLVGAGVSFAQEPAPKKDTTLVLRGKLYQPAQEPIPDGGVVIKDGKIFAAGAWARLARLVPKGAKVIRVPAISPGLIEASSSAGTRGVYAEQGSEVVPELRVIDNVNLRDRAFDRLLERGVTTVHIEPDPASVVGSQGCVVKTAGKARILIEAGVIGGCLGSDAWTRGWNRRPFGAPTHMTRRPNTLMGAVWVFREAFFLAKQAKSPTPAQAVLRDVMAGKRGLHFLARRRGEIEAALRVSREAGVRIVLKEAQEVHHLLDIVAEHKASVIFGPLEDLSRSRRRGVLQPRLDTPALLALSGVPFCLTASDEQGQDDLRGQAMLAVRYGLEPSVALDAVTAAPAAILGLEKRIGSLSKGFDADLVVWSGPPLSATSKPLAVVIDGRVVSGTLIQPKPSKGSKPAPNKNKNPRGSKKPTQRF